MTIHISLVTVLAGLAFVAIGAGGAVGVMVWEPWGGDGGDNGAASLTTPMATPTPYQRKLTGAEAAAIVPLALNRQFIDEAIQEIERGSTPVHKLVETCETLDFNERYLAWIVKCQIRIQLYGPEGPAESDPTDEWTDMLTYRLDDASQELTPVVP